MCLEENKSLEQKNLRYTEHVTEKNFKPNLFYLTNVPPFQSQLLIKQRVAK